MADGMSLPRVITNELLHYGQTHSERGEFLGADITGPAVARIGTHAITIFSILFSPQIRGCGPEWNIREARRGKREGKTEPVSAMNGLLPNAVAAMC